MLDQPLGAGPTRADGGVDGAAGLVHRLDESGGDGAATGDEDEDHAGDRVLEALDEAPGVGRQQRPASRTTTTRRSVMNGGVVMASMMPPTSSSGAPGRTVLLRHRGGVTLPDQHAQEIVGGLAHEGGVVAPDEVGADVADRRLRLSAAGHGQAASKTAARLSHTTRGARHVVNADDPAPESHAQRRRGQRRLPPLVDVEAEERTQNVLLDAESRSG